MKAILTSILLAYSTLLHGQTNLNPVIKTSGYSLEEFIPENWKILQKTSGDLNKDKIDDVVIVLQETNPLKIELLKNEETVYDTVDSNERILIILLKDPATHKYVLNGRTNTFIMRRHSATMSDPFQGIAISNGALHIDFFLWYSMGSWYQTNLTYIFRFQKGQMTLIGAEYIEMHRGTSEQTHRSFNFLTRKMSETKSALDDNCEPVSNETQWNPITTKESKTLETLTEPLGWELIPGVQI